MHAPDFNLKDQNGKSHALADYAGKWVVLYVYPKDDTPGCTKEACGFRDSAQEYADKGATILGLSKDSPASHLKFAEKYHLTFPLLSDPEGNLIQALGAWGEKTFMGKTFDGILRQTFIIDPEGNIAKTYPDVDPVGHADAIITDLVQLQAA